MAEHEVIKRPRVVVEPVDPENRKGLWRVRCAHCPWVSGRSAKSWLEEAEARPHRAKHRAGEAPVCGIVVAVTPSGQSWTWECACGGSTTSQWRAGDAVVARAAALLDAIAHGHRDHDTAAVWSPTPRERVYGFDVVPLEIQAAERTYLESGRVA
ncbi:hypothetical protein [Cellulosimicrobium aquatile]|uniref:hypothetical protein n=1 Tax=Cellulosimicrobium aquatile TaxID=1612203 RepID=UPI0014597C02|nr:hypothetical protein [Cellulosimicrobium aquatile]NMF29623.1 hypothetical protein [Cellulosimicrobium aquatile]